MKTLTLTPTSGWEVGVCLCVSGSGLTALGLALQKFSHADNARKGKCIMFYRQPWWICGLAVFVAGQVGNVIAMAFAPQTMLSCLGALSLVFNALFARFLLKETVRLMEFLSMLGIIIGVLLVVAVTPVAEDTPSRAHRDKTVRQVMSTLLEWDFFMVGFCFMLSLSAGYFVTHHVMSTPTLIPVFWAFATSVASGYTVTLFKCTANILARVPWPWSHVEFYVIIGIAVSLCLVQVHTLNVALKLGNALIVVPVFFSLGVLMQLLQAQIAFEELNNLSGPTRSTIFVSGVVLVLACITAMVRTKILAEAEEIPEASCEEDERLYQTFADESVETSALLKSKGGRCLSEAAMDSKSSRGARHRLRSLPHLDPDVFRESFAGMERRYTISLTGPIGLA